MVSLFTKPLAELSRDDVAAFLEAAPREDLFLELKQDLPEKEGGASQWASGKTTIADKSRNDLAAEIVAFANADGGTLVLGVKETLEEPKRPEKLIPLPDPATLARRLHDAIVGIVEPPLTAFEAAGIVTEEDGAGIVIFRVEPSGLAPHRLSTGEFQSFVRRDDKKRKMTMREIHDMVLQREFARSRFERQFAEAETRFRAGQLLDGRVEGQAIKHARWQVLVIPRKAVRLEISSNRMVPDAELIFEIPNQGEHCFNGSFSRTHENAISILGGIALTGTLRFGAPGYGRRVREERYRDGRYLLSLEVTDTDVSSQDYPHPNLPAEWISIWFLRAINWIVQTRRACGEPMLDFGLQFMTDNRHGFTLLPIGTGRAYFSSFPNHEDLGPQTIASPIYEIGAGGALEQDVNDVFRDLMNSFGAEVYGRKVVRRSYDPEP